MAKVGLSSIIDKGFINSFLGTAQGKTSSQDLARSLSGNGPAKASFSDGLRLGARAFGTAVQNLNSLTNYVGVSQSTLTQLGDLTDEMIALTEKATKSTTGFATRKRLVVQFQDLARDFKKISKDAKIGEREILKAGDLEELFVQLGLDKETSGTVSELFGKFIFSGTDGDTLVDEGMKGDGFARIPKSAFDGPPKRVQVAAFSEEQLTNSAPQYAEITSNGSVSLSGNTASFVEGQNTTDVQNIEALFETDSFSGYSVAASRDDLLGYNAAGNEQLYLFSASGQAIQQLTDNLDSNLQYTSADVSADGTTLGYVASAGGGSVVGVRELSGLGTDPATASGQVYENSNDSYSSIKVSSDGSSIAYREVDVLGDSRVKLRDTATGDVNSSLFQQTNAIEEFDFAKSDELLVNRRTGSAFDLVLFGTDNTSAVVASNLESVRGLATVEEDLTSNGSYYYGFINDSQENVELYREGRGIVARSSFSGENIDSISLATSATGSEAVSIGVKGVRPSVNGDADSELYKLNESGSETLVIPTKLASNIQQTGDILDSASKLLRKPDAFRLLHDLKALKNQIQSNYDALDSARDLIGDNIELVRSAGFAFLDLSEQIGSSEEADDVAREVRKEIRNSPSAALAQAENLENIAVAALTLDTDEVGLDS